MADIERLTIVLSEAMANQIRDAVAAGEYASTSEAVRDAVRLWGERRILRQNDVRRLQQAWDEGKASGTSKPLDMNAVIADARQEAGPKSRRRG